MRLVLSLSVLLLLGCGEPRQTTLAEWEADHPYAKLHLENEQSVKVRYYLDFIPSITGDGAYSVTKTTYVVSVDDRGIVVSSKKIQEMTP